MYKVYCNNMMICDSRIKELCINNPIVTLELNTAGTFTFSFPPEHPYINTIQHLVSIIRVENNDELIFQGFCSNESVDMLGNKYIECEGELSYLNDTILRPNKYQGATVTQLLSAYITEHNDQVENRKKFDIGQITVTDPNNAIYCFTNMNPTIQEIKEDLLDDLGGYLFVRYANGHKYIDYLANPLVNATQTIELGKNLINYDSNIDDTAIATRVIPLGASYTEEEYPTYQSFPSVGRATIIYKAADTGNTYIWVGSTYRIKSFITELSPRLDIKEEPMITPTTSQPISHPYNGDYLENTEIINRYGHITKVAIWDDVNVGSILLNKGKQWLTDSQFQNVIINIKAIDLSLIDADVTAWHLFDSIHVISEYHGMDRWFILSKIIMDLNNPENTEYTLGTVESKSISVKNNANSAGISGMNQKFEEGKAEWLNEAQARATAIINGSVGGYIVTVFNEHGQPTELRIQNALENPSKIWRWNIGGFAYSSDGGQTWGSAAITMDGEIVADFITTGTLRSIDIDSVNIYSSKMVTGSQNGLHIVYYNDTIEGYNDTNLYGKIKPQAGWSSGFPSQKGLAIDSEGMLGFAGRISTRLSTSDNVSYLTVENDQCVKSCTESDYHWVRGAGIDEGTNFYIPMAKSWTFHTVKNGLLVN